MMRSGRPKHGDNAGWLGLGLGGLPRPGSSNLLQCGEASQLPPGPGTGAAWPEGAFSGTPALSGNRHLPPEAPVPPHPCFNCFPGPAKLGLLQLQRPWASQVWPPSPPLPQALPGLERSGLFFP